MSKLGNVGKTIAFKLAASVLFVSVISASISTIYPADAASALPLLLHNLSIKDSVTSNTSEVTIDSVASFSVSLSNNNQSSQPYIIIFDVRDSDNFSVMLELEKGSIGKYTTAIVNSHWIPDELGSYTIHTFAISDSTAPEVLTSVVSGDFEVIEEEQQEAEEPIPEEETEEPPSNVVQDPTDEPTLEELRLYALERINEDRAEFDVPPVELSDNSAAQVHAEDVFATKVISHWMTNGEKPYMTYSRLDGTGFVNQNVATRGDPEYYEDCTSGDYYCERIEPYESIADMQYLLVYEDAVCCDNGHRDNIIDPHHTHVSIGIAYDDYMFVLVQNFENNYIEKLYNSANFQIFSHDDGYLSMKGKLTDAQLSNLVDHSSIIIVEYDPIPTERDYRLYRDNTYYTGGEYVACILQDSTRAYCPGVETISATLWQYENARDYDTFRINANLNNLFELYGSGVYTVIIIGEPVNAPARAEGWEIGSYSIWYRE